MTNKEIDIKEFFRFESSKISQITQIGKKEYHLSNHMEYLTLLMLSKGNKNIRK